MSFFCVNELSIMLCFGFTLNVIAVGGDSSSRITLEMGKHFVRDHTVNTTHSVQDISAAVGSSVDSYQVAFFSLNNCIYRLNISQENGTSLRFIKNSLDIISFHQISTKRFLVSDDDSVKIYQLSAYMNDSTVVETLVCKNSGCCQGSNSRCRENESFVLGPTAVDHRPSSEVAYYVDNAKLYRISLSTNDSAMNFNFDSMGGKATAIAFNDEFSMALIFFGNTKSAYTIDLQSKKTTPIPFYGNQTTSIKQATTIGKDLFLCRTKEKSLLLLNISTGFHSYVHDGITHLPPSKSSSEIIKVSHIADTKYKGYLLALGPDEELMQLNYHVSSLPEEASSVTPVIASNDVSSEKASSNRSEMGAYDVASVFGCAAAVVVLVLGVSIAYFTLRYKKKKRRLIRKYAHRRRQRCPPVKDRVIEDIQLSTFRERGVEQSEDQLKAESVNKVDTTTSTKENQFKDRSLPLQPIQHRQPPVHMDLDMDSVGSLEDIDRPYGQPRERSFEISDLKQNSNIELSTFRQRDVEQRIDQLNEESVNKTNTTNYSKENLIKDRPPLLLLNQHRMSLVHKDLKDSAVEPYHVAVLDPANRQQTTQVLVPSPPYVPSRLSLLPSDRNLDPEQNSNIELTTYRQRGVEQSKDKLNEETVNKATKATINEESLVKDRPPLLLPNQHRLPLVQEDSKDSSAEPYYVEVLDHVDMSTHTKTMVTKPPYVGPRLSPRPHAQSLEHLSCKHHASKLSSSHSPVMPYADPRSEQPSYSDIACVSPVHCADYNPYSYAHEPPKISETIDKHGDNDQKTSNPLQDIAFTITSGKMDIAVQCRFKES